MTLWVLCPHGEKGRHPLRSGNIDLRTFCPGGRVATIEDLIEGLERQGLIHGPLEVRYSKVFDGYVVRLPEDYPKGPKDLDGVPFVSGDLVDLIRFRPALIPALDQEAP